MAEGNVNPNQRASLKQLSIRGVAWSFGGHGASEFIRLASNLILTRLLIPEDFGLMLMVNVILMGLQLFSDVGIGPSIIQNPRGTEQRFLNTAWTIQVMRGGFLWLIATALAYPFALLYDMPKLAELIPIAAITAVISGFNSTKLFSLNRQLHLGKITILGLGQALVSTSAMIIWAYISPSTWALIGGGIVGCLFHAIASHFITPGPLNKFAWDRTAVRELFKFGKWIIFSTAIGFFANRGDRLILGKVMTGTELGLLSIALVLAQSLIKLISRIGRKVLFPLYTRLAEKDPQSLRRKIARVRGALLAATIPPMCILTVWGSDIIELLWDPRYKDAGWMLQILAAGGIMRIINVTITPVLLAKGDSFRHLLYTALNGITLVCTMGIGIAVNGPTGGIIGAAIAPVINYLFITLLVRRYNVLMPVLDFGVIAGATLLIGIGFYVSQ